MDISGKVAVVTGGSGGIGQALAAHLLRGGCDVSIVDLDLEATEAVAAGLATTGSGRVQALAADVSDSAGIAEVLDRTESAYGPVDLYFANAGVPGGPGLGDSDEEWARAIEVNVLAHVRAARLLVPGWLDRGAGYFVSTASAAGLLTQIGLATYSVTKHATVAFAEWLSITYGDQGIRVSCVCPMGVRTPLLHSGTDSGDELGAAASRSVITAGAVLAPDQVAETTLEAVREERFYILPHPEVAQMYAEKAADPARWLSGMRRFQNRILTDLR